ncbi:MAG: caspase domain-containing protein [Granulosicoccus sp.]
MSTRKGLPAIGPGQFLLLAFLLAMPLIGHARFVALVIGNQNYPDAALVNPANDAEAVARAFEAIGYDDVQLVKDADTRAIDAALDQFSETAANSDVAIIYYAGHGVQIDGKNYLVPVDVSLMSSRDVRDLTTQRELTDEVGRASQFGLVILDACRDNPFSERVTKQRPRSVSTRGLTREESTVGSNTLVAYATASDDVANDGAGVNSPFTTALLTHVTNPDFDVYQLFGTVRDTVVRHTDGQQVPYHYGSTGGQRYFLHPIGHASQVYYPPDDESTSVVISPISLGDMLVASSRIQTLKNDLMQRDWARLLDSRSLSVAARQNIGRWRSTSGDLNVLIENLRARESTQTVYADVVVSRVDAQPDRIKVRVVRNGDGNWSPIKW